MVGWQANRRLAERQFLGSVAALLFLRLLWCPVIVGKHAIRFHFRERRYEHMVDSAQRSQVGVETVERAVLRKSDGRARVGILEDALPSENGVYLIRLVNVEIASENHRFAMGYLGNLSQHKTCRPRRFGRIWRRSRNILLKSKSSLPAGTSGVTNSCV